MAQVQNIDWHISSGHRIHAQLWQTKETPLAVIGFTHGMGGHIGRYEHLVDFFLSHGYHVVGFDQIGHGKSEGKRGDTPSYSLMVENFERLTAYAKKHFSELPLILYAHSMGANVLLNYILSNPPHVKAAIFSSPWIKLVQMPAVLTIKIARFIAKFHPAYLYSAVLKHQALSRDKVFLENYYEDKWCHSKISLRFFFAMIASGRRILKLAKNLSIPTLLYHGTGDRITSYKASKEFYERVANKSMIHFELLEGVYHEPHNDLGKEKVYALLLNFIQQTLQKQ